MAKIILDCDDVLLNGADALARYMLAEHGLDCSNFVGNLYPSQWPDIGNMQVLEVYTAGLVRSEFFKTAPAMPGAVEMVRDLKLAGHELIIVSSISDDPVAKIERQKNLKEIFGEGVFSQIILLPLGVGNKESAIKSVKPDFFIDDALSNLQLATRLGVQAVMPKLKINIHEHSNPKTPLSSEISTVDCLQDVVDLMNAFECRRINVSKKVNNNAKNDIGHKPDS